MRHPKDTPFESNESPDDGEEPNTQAPPRRKRLFTPVLEGSNTPKPTFKQVVSPHLIKREQPESIEVAIQSPLGGRIQEPPPPAGSTKAAEDRRSGTVLHKVLEESDVVHEWSDPNKLENRARRSVIAAGAVLLTAVVLYALFSAFLFRATPKEGSVAETAALNLPLTIEAPTIDPASAIRAGVTAIQHFLEAPSPEARAAWLPSGETPVTEPLLRQQAPLANGATVQADRAHAYRLGQQPAVLVPVVDRDGLTRIAAAWQESHGSWKVDWRSLITPQRVSWQEFVQAPTPEAALFRLRFEETTSPTPQGRHRLTAMLPSNKEASLSIEFSPNSRAAQELTALLAAAGSSSPRVVEAEVYLQKQADGTVGIADFIPDRWKLP